MQRSGNSHDGADAAPHASALAHGVELADLGVLRVRGADAERFLQGQLSNDLTRLARESSILAGLHNPQGRTVALLRLAATGEHDFLAVLPRALVASVAQRLSRFILRSKVQVTDESSGWRIRGNVGEQAAMREPSSVREQPSGGLALAVPGEPARWIGIVPAAARASESQTASEAQAASESHAAALAARNGWRLLDIAAGLPQIYPQTSELFVAQMLNLDAIDAISFSKGCYTGQEVIARSHYRGRVKRRMQRWRTTAPAALSPGDSARIADGRTVRVVDAAQRPDGSCEFLAVAPLAASASTAAGAAAADEEPAAEPTDKILLEAEQLPLPYGLAS